MGLPADDPVREVRFVGYAALVRLGQNARARDEYRNAAELLARAARFGEADQPKELVIARRMTSATALASLRRLEEAEAEIGPALDEADRQSCGWPRLVVLGELRQKQGRDAEAVEALTTALAEATEAERERWMSAAVRQLGLVDYYAGRLRRAEERFCARTRNRPTQATTAAARPGRWSIWPGRRRPEATTRPPTGSPADATELFGELEDTGGLAWCAGTEALVQVLQGRLADGRATARALIPLAETLAESWGVAMCRTVDAMAAAELGDVQAAQHEADLAVAALTESGDNWGRSFALVASATAARAAGHPTEALRLLRGSAGKRRRRWPRAQRRLRVHGSGPREPGAGQRRRGRPQARQALGVLVRLDLEPHAALGVAVLDAQVSGRGASRWRRSAGCGRCWPPLPAARCCSPAGRPWPTSPGRWSTRVSRRRRWRWRGERSGSRPKTFAAGCWRWRALGTALHETGDEAGGRAYLQALDIAVATQSRSEEAQTRRLLAALRDGAERSHRDVSAPELSALDGLAGRGRAGRPRGYRAAASRGSRSRRATC